MTKSKSKNPTDVIPLWPAGEVPLALGEDPKKDVPTLTPYWPDSARFPYPCPVMIILPGGGYKYISYPNENIDYALFLNQYGIACFVLTYRVLGNGYRYPAQHLDVQRAIKMARYHGTVGDWDIDPNRIGIIGSSAGGHLSALALTRFDMGAASLDPLEHFSSRPNLGALCYPLITLESFDIANLADYTSTPTPELRTYLSNEHYVTSTTAPTFLFHNADDTVVPVEHSRIFDEALEKAGVKHALHVYPTGGHGVGLGVHPYDPLTVPTEDLLPWTRDLTRFLAEMGWMA